MSSQRLSCNPSPHLTLICFVSNCFIGSRFNFLSAPTLLHSILCTSLVPSRSRFLLPLFLPPQADSLVPAAGSSTHCCRSWSFRTSGRCALLHSSFVCTSFSIRCITPMPNASLWSSLSATTKRPARSQQPNLYLEPKWLRCCSHNEDRLPLAAFNFLSDLALEVRMAANTHLPRKLRPKPWRRRCL